MRSRGFTLLPFFVAAMTWTAALSLAQGPRRFEVSVTNVTKGQTFTPILVATHRAGVSLFELGSEASPELEAVAETGDTGPLAAMLESLPGVRDVQVTGGLLGPGETATLEVDARGPFQRVSVVSMLIPTNDGFFALNGVEGPRNREPDVHFSPAYDAGTEANEEMCADIPGPQCGGSGAIDAGTAEGGVVHINAAIQGVGDLSPGIWDWRNPVARIVVRRIP
jgi:hypothetical protein